MTSILTPQEAAKFVRTTENDDVVAMLLPLIDMYIENATGRDWTQDASIHPTAKSAAGILLVAWYDNPTMMGQGVTGIHGPLVQLEAEALKYRKYQFNGSSNAGGIAIDGALIGDEVQKLVGIYGDEGDQSDRFEDVISVAGQIQQLDSEDLSENIYVVILKSPAEDVGA